MRPLRLYQHVFLHVSARFECARTGRTPCQAKGKALEEELKAKSELPKTGWRLVEQRDITHVLYQRRTS
jgi:hypothetical protein